MPKSTRIPVAAVRLDGGTQSRRAVNDAVVSDYTECFRAGVSFPDIEVYHDGSDYWPADGIHRTIAAIKAGESEINAAVHVGTRTDAKLHSAGSNSKHGLQRSVDDKRHAVRMLLDDGQWHDRSIRWFADACGVRFELAKDVYDRWHEEKNRPKPESVTGADGVQRRAVRRDSPEGNHTGREPELDNLGDPPERDAIGREVPEHLRDACITARDARGIIQDLGRMAARCRAFASSAGGAYLNAQDTERQIRQAQENLKFSMFHTECPECMDSEPGTGCSVCRGFGFIVRDVFNRLSDKQRRKLEA